MREQTRHLVYARDAWEVDIARRELHASGVTVPLGSRAFDIFVVLIQSADKLVTKDELMARVWPHAIVEDNKLQVHISAIRKALGPDRSMLKTSFGRGYRLVGAWACRQTSLPADAAASSPSARPVTPPLSNVPAATSALISRTAAIRHLQDRLSSCRAITLTGPGGIGKTALVLEFARSLEATFQGDRLLVDLVCQLDPALVPSTVASVLGLELGADEISAESIARAIGERSLLLVLDNCEHVVDAVARLAETVLRFCPATSIVATSREALNIDGEHVYHVPALDVPSHDEEELRSAVASTAFRSPSSLRLLVQRRSDLNWFFPIWKSDSDRWVVGAARHCRGIRRCARLSTGVMTCCPSRNSACCAG